MTVHPTHLALELRLQGGGQARVVTSDGDRVTLQSSRPYPPGSTLVGEERDGSGQYRVKVRGSRKGSDNGDVFAIEGRFVNLTREQRSALVTRFSTPDASAVVGPGEKP